MEAAVKAKCEYDTHKPAAGAAAAAASGPVATTLSSLSFRAGSDLKLRASFTDATFVNGPSLTGLSLAVEKPGSFIVDYNVPKKDIRFQFMNSVRVLDKPLNLTYIHNRNDNRTVIDGTLVLDPSNKVSASHSPGSVNGRLKYTYLRGGGITSFEPSYDFGKNAWDFAVSRKVYGDDVVRASYQGSTQILGIEWGRNSKTQGCFKISATVNLAEEEKRPKLVAESTWNMEM